jgi:hypothetical protein
VPLPQVLVKSNVCSEKEKSRMACTDTAKDVNNALHQCGDAAAKIITLQYAAYMN